MPPKNKKGRNGFYYFMQEMRQDELDQGRHRSMEEMQTLASPGWQALTPDEKEYYNNKAKQEKRKGATDDERKFTSLGVSFATVEANTREVEEQLKVMKATMKKIVSSSPEALTRNTFYVCHVNHYFKYDIDCYQPAEIALAEFSLEKGLTDTLHFILHPGNIPIGMKADAQIWAEKTHGIRLTDRQGEEELVRERNYVHVYSAVVNFLKKDAGVNHGAMVLPIIYTMPDSINNNTNLTAVKYCMRFLSKCAHEDRDLFRIYPLPELFFLLRQKYKFDDAPTVAVMESEIEKDQFSYVSDLGCEFHEARDLSLHCSLSMVKRWIFTVCDHICAHAGVEMVPGHHVPHKADFTWTTVHSTNKKLNPSASAGYIDPPPRDPPRFFDPTQLQLTGPSLVTNAHPNGGDLIRRGFMKRGLSPDVVATLCNSLSQTTLKQYASSYNLWVTFCTSNLINPLDVTTPIVLRFFQHLLDTTSQSYNSFNTHRSALALLAEFDLAQDYLIKRFIKAIFRLRPPAAKYKYTWDPQVVLQYFVTVTDDSLAFRAKKLIVLLLLASGQRMQTIHAIERCNIVFSDSGVTVYIPKLLKTSRPGATAPTISIPQLHSQPLICVPSNLKRYLADTNSLNQSALFVTLKKPFQPATIPTLSRWVKEILKSAGIDVSVFSSHSTRHAAVSAAARRGVAINTIFDAAGWSQNSNMFQAVYNRPLCSQANFAAAVLST